MPRIAATDPALLEQIRRFHADIPCVTLTAAELADPASASRADIFLLTEPEAETALEAWPVDDRPTLVALVTEEGRVPPVYRDGLADDLLVLPLRALDLERTLHAHDQVAAIRGLERTSRAMPELVKRLQEDIHLAQKIQRRLIREKFPPMGGLTVKSKYYCGLKAGGDYFDVFEFPDGVHAGVIISDSSSYSLSNTFISSLIQFSAQGSPEQRADPQSIVRAIYAQIRDSMKEKDHLSIFYGVLNRKTYQFRFVECGTPVALHRGAEGALAWVGQGKEPALSAAHGEIPAAREISLEPGDRLMLASDGWAEALGSAEMKKHFEGQIKQEDAQIVLNELAFHLKKGIENQFGNEDDDPEVDFPMPPQDCSLLVFDLAKNVLRLAK